MLLFFVSNGNALVVGRGKLFVCNAYEENRRQGVMAADSNVSLEWAAFVGAFAKSFNP